MPDLSFHEINHINKLLQQQGSIKYIFDEFVRKTGVHLTRWDQGRGTNVWALNESVQESIQNELNLLSQKLKQNIENYTTDAWTRSNIKTDELINGYIKNLALTDVVKKGMFARNNEVLTKFLERKVDGLTLSNRVWNIAEGAMENIEFYLESGLSTGRSAAKISQDIRQLLKDPDKRFHRVRNSKGKLVPSQPMKDYHPGQGVYRSSYKNALRLAATNTNEMYRITDCDRWSKLDFITGFNVRRAANNYGPCVICDSMAGNYPKNYVFSGWHPFCICFATPILMNEDNFIDSLVNDDFGNVNYITDIPSGARDYISGKIDSGALKLDSYLLKNNKSFFK